MIRLENISKTYTTNINQHVLDEINIEFHGPSINTIYGNSGTGKTTLLNIIGLIDIPTAGSVYYENKKIENYDLLSSFRLKNYGYVLQDHYLMPEFTVYDNLKLPMVINNNYLNADCYIDDLLDKFKLIHLKNKFPCSISAGEAQRFAVLRSIVNKPKIIIADEPTSNLDDNNAKILISLFEDLKIKYNYIIFVATHDKRFIEISDNSYKLDNKNLKKI